MLGKNLKKENENEVFRFFCACRRCVVCLFVENNNEKDKKDGRA